MNWLIRILTRFGPTIDGNPAEFLERPYKNDWREFIVGSVRGLYRTHGGEYQILAVHNTDGGNGHFKKTLEWFLKSSRRDRMPLSFLEVGNPVLLERLRSLGFTGTNAKMTLSRLESLKESERGPNSAGQN